MDLKQLKVRLQLACVGFEGLIWNRMFGCDAVFRSKQIFGLIWKESRIGLRYPESNEFEQRIRLKGSSKWEPGGRTTKHWVLVPNEVVDNPDELKEWAAIAHLAADGSRS